MALNQHGMASLVGRGYSSGDELFDGELFEVVEQGSPRGWMGGGELFGEVEQGSPCGEVAQPQVSTERARGRAVAQA